MRLTTYCTLVDLCTLLQFIYPQSSDLCSDMDQMRTSNRMRRAIASEGGSRWCLWARKGAGEGGHRARRGKRGRFLGGRVR